MIVILWSYEVRPGATTAFEKVYGPEGDWAVLFRRAAGYLGTELLRGTGTTYLTIDRWRSSADFEAFMAANQADYEALDRFTQGWTTLETRIGLWSSLG